MAVVSEVLFSKLTDDRRLDAEYYTHPGYTLRRRFEQNGIAFLDYFERVIHPNEFKREYIDTPGHLFLRAQNVKPGCITVADPVYVDETVYRALPDAIARENDLLLVRTGANLGDVARVTGDYIGALISSHTLRLVPRPDAPVHALEFFFCSRIGRDLLLNLRSGGTHGQINGHALRQLALPDLRPVENAARAMARAIQRQRRIARERYAEAEALMESALGLDNLDLTPRLFYERPYVDVQAAGRLDAEFFQPRMQNLIEALSRDKLTIGDVAKLSKRRFKPTPGKDFEYIEIGDLSGDGMTNSKTVAGEDAPSRATWIVQPGDIITTTVRPIRRLSAIITDEQAGYVCSSGFAVLTPRNPDIIAPELFLVYLRLPLVCELLDLHTTASMYPTIATSDLIKIPIAVPDEQTRREIVAKVRESFAAQREARRLLDEAKAMVESAILDGSAYEQLSVEDAPH